MKPLYEYDWGNSRGERVAQWDVCRSVDGEGVAMKEWCLEHPWMTFFLLGFAIEAAALVLRTALYWSRP